MTFWICTGSKNGEYSVKVLAKATLSIFCFTQNPINLGETKYGKGQALPSLITLQACRNFLNIANHLRIAAAALKNDQEFAGTVNVALLLSCADERAGSKYEHRTFFIDRVLLLSREASNAAAREMDFINASSKDPQRMAGRTDTDHFKLMVGWCKLPSGETSNMQMGTFSASDAADHVLPPGFDLNRYITHVNRGITHFHASFWPLPRTISDADLESAEPPPGWRSYMGQEHWLISRLKGGQGIIGRVHPDGTREPIYKFSDGGHFRHCAPGETDSEGPAKFKKPLVGPSRMVQLIPRHLDIYEHVLSIRTWLKCVDPSAEQALVMEKSTMMFDPSMSLEDAKEMLCPGQYDYGYLIILQNHCWDRSRGGKLVRLSISTVPPGLHGNPLTVHTGASGDILVDAGLAVLHIFLYSWSFPSSTSDGGFSVSGRNALQALPWSRFLLDVPGILGAWAPFSAALRRPPISSLTPGFYDNSPDTRPLANLISSHLTISHLPSQRSASSLNDPTRAFCPKTTSRTPKTKSPGFKLSLTERGALKGQYDDVRSLLSPICRFPSEILVDIFALCASAPRLTGAAEAAISATRGRETRRVLGGGAENGVAPKEEEGFVPNKEALGWEVGRNPREANLDCRPGKGGENWVTEGTLEGRDKREGRMRGGASAQAWARGRTSDVVKADVDWAYNVVGAGLRLGPRRSVE
ncbi:hypothetical protein DFH09DRAFT_1458806 [Mycena vulgaris]|nr:hypothetical protein DFH09DRAFT_1458806 [Mycena vulgaris]